MRCRFIVCIDKANCTSLKGAVIKIKKIQMSRFRKLGCTIYKCENHIVFYTKCQIPLNLNDLQNRTSFNLYIVFYLNFSFINLI